MSIPNICTWGPSCSVLEMLSCRCVSFHPCRFVRETIRLWRHQVGKTDRAAYHLHSSDKTSHGSGWFGPARWYIWQNREGCGGGRGYGEVTRRYAADVCPNQAVSSEGYPSKKKTDQYVETSLTGCSKSLVQITNVRPLFFIKALAVSPKEIKCRGSTVCILV